MRAALRESRLPFEHTYRAVFALLLVLKISAGMDAEMNASRLSARLADLANRFDRFGATKTLFFVEEPADLFHQLHEFLGVLFHCG
jgi:hypothetical protein